MQRLEILTAFTNSLCHCPSHPFLGSLPPHSRIKDPCWSSCSKHQAWLCPPDGAAQKLPLFAKPQKCLELFLSLRGQSSPKAARGCYKDGTRADFTAELSQRLPCSPGNTGSDRSKDRKPQSGVRGRQTLLQAPRAEQTGRRGFHTVICSKLCNKGKFQGAEHRPVAASPPGSGALTKSWNCSLSSLHSRLMHFYGFSSLPPS